MTEDNTFKRLYCDSLYGVLGLQVFRFYDFKKEKSSHNRSILIGNLVKRLQTIFIKELGTADDYVIYIDTDLFLLRSSIGQKDFLIKS